MSGVAWVALVAGGALFVAGFVLLVKVRREADGCFDMLQQTVAEKQYMQMLKEVGVGKGIFRCEGVDFTVTTISNGPGGWQLQAEDTATWNKRMTVGGSDVR